MADENKRFIHSTVEERDLNKIIPTEYPMLGDAKLTLAMLHQALSERLRGKPRGLAREVAARIEEQNRPWLDAWRPYLTSNAKPLSPYRVIYDLLQTVDVANTIITHDAGSPRDEMIPFWKTVTPLSYIGWGKTTQLGYGLGLTMGAKVAHPDKLCINFWGEAAIGMTGMDFETCVRCQIPIMSILSNNFGMKTEYAAMKLSHEKYRTCDISGNYADFAKAMGGYGERVTEPEQVVHAIVNGIRATKEGKPVLLEFITTQDVRLASARRGAAASDPPRRSERKLSRERTMFISKKHLDRRTFLRGMGATVALPLLDAMIPARTLLAATAARPMPRLAFVYFPHGAIMDEWTPATAGRDIPARPDPRAAGAVQRAG